MGIENLLTGVLEEVVVDRKLPGVAVGVVDCRDGAEGTFASAGESAPEDRRLNLSDEVRVHLGERWSSENLRVYRGKKIEGQPVYERVKKEVTVLHLMTHTSGLSYACPWGTFVDEIYQDSYAKAAAMNERETPEQLEKRLSELPLCGQPGEYFTYSASTDILGRILEVVCKTTLDRVLDELAIAPLNMQNTFFPPERMDSSLIAKIYQRSPAGELQDITDFELDRDATPIGGSGLVSTVADLMKFCAAFMTGRSASGVELLSKESIDLVKTDRVGLIQDRICSEYSAFGRYKFGLGVAIEPSDFGPGCGGKGSFFWIGFGGNFVNFDPESGIGIVFAMQVFTDIRWDDCLSSRRKIAEAVYKRAARARNNAGNREEHPPKQIALRKRSDQSLLPGDCSRGCCVR
ncbi:hypothetical protein NDN08_007427 [Rhodosorus marinus]|uniref:Beta-lactamase-related domain-containing protein n=1 Tax=Rhodosorus marinus TaxID=101924 RepID=A0AAV8V1L9_9RHOD|nr:hypothetical protein NDN08_007427 [Rhodosorus marinus]